MANVEILGYHSQAGFYKAPVTKALVGWSLLSFVCVQIPMFRSLKKYFICQIPESLYKAEVCCVATSKLVFLDAKDLVLSLLLIYTFRLFERRLGSRKFSSHLASFYVLTTGIEVMLTWAIRVWSDSLWSSGLLSVGLYHAVFPWFVNFFFDVPVVSSTTVFGLNVSSKIITYFLGFHLIVSNEVAAVAGIVAGLLVRQNFLWIQKWLFFNERLASIAYGVFGKYMDSAPPPAGIMGATLEIQRAQRIEAIEQQLMRRERNGPWNPGRFMQQQQPNPPVVPSEENVRALTDMGFSRQQVEQALRLTNNNIQEATNVLLQEL